MPKLLVGRGTLLNTATVAGGALIGLAVGKYIPGTYKDIAQAALGLVTVGLGLKLFLQARSILLVAAALVLGGCLGLALGLQSGLESFGEWARRTVGGQGGFTQVVVTTSILFCVGPMTLLGCLRDALEDDMELLAIKSTMDGFVALFFAATVSGGEGLLVTAVVVFVVQGAITIAASPLKRFANDEHMIAEATATGGAMLCGIGLGLLELKDIPVANYIPALLLAPLFVALSRRVAIRRTKAVSSEESP